MQWWCAAQGVAWTWSWRPYPGVWIFIGLLLLAYLRFGGGSAASSRQRTASFAGLIALWVALDWPIGALGSGYLASLHMVQFLLIALVAPPLLLMGIPAERYQRLATWRGFGLVRVLTVPLVALLLFNTVVVATHWPGLVDSLMSSQLGSFVLDVSWLLAGLILWWPVVSPVPDRPRFPLGVRMGYLIVCTVLMTLPYVFLTFAELPFYATYELAPPVGVLSARDDQRVAGLIMRLGGGTILWTAAGVLFWLWYRRENDPQPIRVDSRTQSR
ncbi:MAG: cytochrome c oxidase assembly protein [Gemmatimonadota bacterium]|nr:cytochrome c oxidase assembly protein [Gemmatimonadota bacterium]